MTRHDPDRAPARRGLPPARRADPRRLVLRRLLRPDAKTLLEDDGHHPHVLMQVFQKEGSLLRRDRRGARRAPARAPGPRAEDGSWDRRLAPARGPRPARGRRDRAATRPCMTIEGDYALFAHLETVYLGCLARRSLVMRNVGRVVEAARGKPIFFFPARHDHWLVQTGDGWGAHVAGAIGVSTDAQASWWGGRGHRHRPARADRRLRRATPCSRREKFAARYAERDERDRARRLRERLGAHRARGGRALGDAASGASGWTRARRSSTARCGTRWAAVQPTGVTPRLVEKVRAALDAAGFADVRIVVSGGFDGRADRRVRGRRRARRRLRRRLLAAARLGTTTRPTSSWSTGGRARRRAAELRPNPRLDGVVTPVRQRSRSGSNLDT